MASKVNFMTVKVYITSACDCPLLTRRLKGNFIVVGELVRLPAYSDRSLSRAPYWPVAVVDKGRQ